MYDLLKEIREEQKIQSKDINGIKMDVNTNTEDLKYHIKRTDMLEELHMDNAKRIDILEKPAISIKPTVKKKIAKVTAFATGFVALAWGTIRLLDYINIIQL